MVIIKEAREAGSTTLTAGRQLACKRCKDFFTPRKQELRCGECLRLRRLGRIAKRQAAKESRESYKAIERILKSNGARKRAPNVTMLY